MILRGRRRNRGGRRVYNGRCRFLYYRLFRGVFGTVDEQPIQVVKREFVSEVNRLVKRTLY